MEPPYAKRGTPVKKIKIGSKFSKQEYCFDACIYYPEDTVTGCEYNSQTKTCHVYMSPVNIGNKASGSHCLLLKDKRDALGIN